MTRKDYIKFASMLSSHAWPPNSTASSDTLKGYELARQDIGRSIAVILRLDNPNFDPVRFFEAAKLGND